MKNHKFSLNFDYFHPPLHSPKYPQDAAGLFRFIFEIVFDTVGFGSIIYK